MVLFLVPGAFYPRGNAFLKKCAAPPARGDYEGIETSGPFGVAGHMGDLHLHAVLHHVRKLAAAPATNPPSDRDLLDRFVGRRDEAAFAALVERHGAMVLGICRRVLRHAHDAEDAWQATFLVLARKAATIRRKDALGALAARGRVSPRHKLAQGPGPPRCPRGAPARGRASGRGRCRP